MTDITFARSEHDYESYSDFWRIVELSGFRVIRIGEIDAMSDNVYIFSTPATHWHDGVERRGWPNAKARIIYYNIEWYADVDYRSIPGVEVWSADRWHALKIGAKYVPFGSHPGLPDAPLQDCPKRYDLAAMMYIYGRREALVNRLAGVGIRLAPNAWGLERHETIQQAKAFLHIHQFDYAPTVPPQRFALAAAYRKAVISEQVADQGVIGDAHGVLWCDYDHMDTFVKIWKDDIRLKDYGDALFYLLCEKYSFRRNVEAAL